MDLKGCGFSRADQRQNQCRLQALREPPPPAAKAEFCFAFAARLKASPFKTSTI
jgi:hypothetical protein